MSLWGWIVLAGLASLATKLLGYLVPERLLQSPRMTRVAGTLTIGLLTSLTVVNTFTSGPTVGAGCTRGLLGRCGLGARPSRAVPGGGRSRRRRCCGATGLWFQLKERLGADGL